MLNSAPSNETLLAYPPDIFLITATFMTLQFSSYYNIKDYSYAKIKTPRPYPSKYLAHPRRLSLLPLL